MVGNNAVGSPKSLIATPLSVLLIAISNGTAGVAAAVAVASEYNSAKQTFPVLTSTVV
jgi:hypothetical protein